jgi:hypothetical protein
MAFYLLSARGTALPLLVASSVRLTGVTVHWAVFVWHYPPHIDSSRRTA